MALDENNLNNLGLDQPLGPNVAQPEAEGEIIRKSEKSGGGIGSLLGLLIVIPSEVYSYVNSPSRYSAEKLEKKADQHAKKQVRAAEKLAKKAKKTLTEQERASLYNNAQVTYHGDFVRGYRKRADYLARGSSNKYLLAAIEDENNRKNQVVVTKNKVQSKTSIPTLTVPVGSESIQKDLSGFAEKIPSTKLPTGGQSILKANLSLKPGTPNFPDKSTPKIPGRKRTMPHLSKPGLPNPMQQLANFLSPFNPTKIIIISLGGIFLATFLIVFLLGASGGGGGGATGGGGGNPPVAPSSATFTFVALGDSITAWPCYPVTFGCVDSHPWGSYDFTGNPWPTDLTTIDTNLILKHNGGLPAQTSIQIESQFSAQVTPYNPDILFILAGTNDGGNGIIPSVTITTIEKMITDAKNIGVKEVILLTIPHQCAGGYTAINNGIRALASDYTPVIDISGPSVLTCADFQADELHLTDAGAQKLAEYIDGQIKSRNLLPTQSVPTVNFHLYCQYAYPKTATNTCDIYTYGCGPTSLAMILTTFGDTITPVEVGTQYGMGCTIAGTTPDELTSALNSLKPTYVYQSVGVSNNNLNPSTVETLTSKGFYIIAGACMTGGYRGVTGHTTVITSVNTDGTFNDADPTWNSPPNHACTTDANINMRILNPTYPGPDLSAGTPCNDTTYGPWGGWAWAYAVKKQ